MAPVCWFGHTVAGKYSQTQSQPQPLCCSTDADPLDCPDSVHRFQDELHEALQEYESSCREQRRAGRLLMTLPLLRQTAGQAVHVLLQLHRHHRIPLHKLLLEMLDAKSWTGSFTLTPQWWQWGEMMRCSLQWGACRRILTRCWMTLWPPGSHAMQNLGANCSAKINRVHQSPASRSSV